MAPDDLAYASIRDLARRIERRELSPVELVRAALDRIERLEPKVHAFLDVFAESALADAKAAEREIASGRYRGPLHGIPVGLKDIIDSAGTPTTGGATFLRGNVATRDATATARLKQAGAVIMGKLNLVEFALGATGLNPHCGNTHNPWDLECITGGSSAGSGGSVAAGLLVGALGSDTGGSIRIPAALCGIAGLKPTYGLVSTAGVLPVSWSCDHVGPMARRSADCAYMLNVLAGYDPRDPASSWEPVLDFTSGLGRGLGGIRVGVPQHFFFDDLEPEIGPAVREALALMERNGARLIDLPMPWVSKGRAINTAIAMPEAVSVHERWISEHADEYSAEVRARLQAAFAIPAVEYVRAQRARRWFTERMKDAMQDVDVLVTPTVPTRTPRIKACIPPPGANEGREGGRLPVFTGVFNTTGQPSLSVACGFTEDGMPIGMMITGKPFEDATVLRVGDAYETLAGWHERRPPL